MSCKSGFASCGRRKYLYNLDIKLTLPAATPNIKCMSAYSAKVSCRNKTQN